ncbi:MAG: DUF3253 domain-containing protein [Acidobacteria bacterium]|nr:DUF3253 domain-containing protein [Acidobacteriota bacterium]
MQPLTTPDGRYLVVRGRLWRAANPQLTDDERSRWTATLMDARRAVAAAKRAEDSSAERRARRAVHRAKVALGERGPVWWTDGAPDYNRRLARNTPYATWFEETQRWEEALLAMLDERTSSVCPSEVARRMEPDGWRAHMEAVRDAARRLAHRGLVTITQRGKPLDPDEECRGPIRITRAS